MLFLPATLADREVSCSLPLTYGSETSGLQAGQEDHLGLCNQYDIFQEEQIHGQVKPTSVEEKLLKLIESCFPGREIIFLIRSSLTGNA